MRLRYENRRTLVTLSGPVRLRRAATGEVEARPQRGGHQGRRLACHEASLRARLAAVDDATLAELRAWLRDEHRVVVSIATLWAELARMGLTLKKTRTAKLAGDLR